jgi:hypothetical protein
MNINVKLMVAALIAATVTSCSKEELGAPAAPATPLHEKNGTLLRYAVGLAIDHGTAPADGLTRDVSIVLKWSLSDPADPVAFALATIYSKGLHKVVANKVVVNLATAPVDATGNGALDFKQRLNISGTQLAAGFLDDTYIIVPKQAVTLSGEQIDLVAGIETYEIL